MNNRVFLWSLIILFVVLLSACGELNTEILDNNWEYALGNLSDTIDDAYEFDYQALESTLNMHTKVEGGKGIIWVRNVFTLPEALKNKELAFLLGRINLADEAYLNGVLIGKRGKMGEVFFSDWNTYRFYPVPKSLFKINSENTLLIKIFVNQEGNISNTIALDKRDKVENAFSLGHFFFTRLNLMISLLLLFVGVYHLFIYIKRTKDLENLFYALLLFMNTIYHTNFFITYLFPNISISYVIHQKIVYSTMMLSLLFLKMFILEFLKVNENKIVKYVIYGLNILTVIGLLISPTYEFLFFIAKGPVQYIFIITLVYIGYNVISTLIKNPNNREVKTLFAGYVILSVAAIMDIIASIMLFEDYIYLSSYGVAFFLIMLSVILANRFVNYRNEAEDLNEHLEQKVEERTEQLASANEEMSRINQDLTETNNNLERARAIAEKDMKMAVNVQSAFFPKRSPETDKWDVAFVFNPMAGVSGDFYDFYSLTENHIDGVGLFDVSGHGIASGLITMIAKSIIARHFVKMTDKSLNDVMQIANKNLIYEMDNVDNYLTGILLRFNNKNDIVEYVNAGHTDLLYRKARTKNVHIVKFKDDRPFKGMFLGLRGMETEYPPIKFRVRNEDVLLLYSDCLNESVNEDMEEYEVERIIKSLEEAPNTSAKDILDHVLNDFYSFVGNKPLNDDLTVIVLKRK